MKSVLLILVLGLLAGCSSHPPASTASPQDGGVVASAKESIDASSTGPQVAAELTRRYRDTRINCGKDSMPAFLCSGILLRGTALAAGFDVWDPSPTAIRTGGTSFSYVRSDYKMKRLAFTYNKGLIFFPILSTPAGKANIEVLCFFPVDGTSDARTNNGCGEVPGYPSSVACNSQNIRTGEQWAANYRKYASTGHHYRAVCSFDVRDAANNLSGPNFYQGMIGGRAISPTTFNIPNDVKLKTWQAGLAKTLPIEAFFYYVRDGKTGLKDVQVDQRRFKVLTGVAIPIIKVTMPGTLEENTTFAYQEADQAVN